MTQGPEAIPFSRRRLLQAAATGLAAAVAPAWAQEQSLPEIPRIELPPFATPRATASDLRYWEAVRGLYDVPDDFVQLEHGNWGMMARPVAEVYQTATAQVNRYTSYYSRGDYGDHQRIIMGELARVLGVDPEEIVPVRNATEALTTLITGYNRLRPGDAVMYADLDYPAMQGAMRALQERRGVSAVNIDLPEPATVANLLAAYDEALAANPQVRMLLITHISHRTGLMLPVRDIVALARARNVDVIVDSAHAWGQVDFALPDLDADFVGLNLHKWIGAPLGLGLMYVKRERLADIDLSPADGGGRAEAGSIERRVHTGTLNLAALLAVPTALEVHHRIGAAHKEARLRHLRNLWAERLRDHPRIDILTPTDPALFAGITSFRVRGQSEMAENMSLAQRLWDEHRIFTVARDGVAKGACVRVTPAVFTREAECEALATALESEV